MKMEDKRVAGLPVEVSPVVSGLIVGLWLAFLAIMGVLLSQEIRQAIEEAKKSPKKKKLLRFG